MNISYLGQFIDYDIDSGVLIIKVDYTDPPTQKAIEEAVTNQTSTRFNANLKPKQGKQYRHQKAWYGSLKKILQCQGIEPTSQNMEVFDEEMRKNIFPVNYYVIGRQRLPKVSAMSEMTSEELDERIAILQERYSYLKDSNGNPIDFTDLKG